MPVPKLLSDDWVLINTEACGICGSDLGLLTGKDSFSMEPYSSFPAVLGHEAIGHIVKLGKNVTEFKEGNRVAVDNVLPCITRDIDPVCEHCLQGEYALCENFREGSLSAGPVNGYNASVGGAFAEYFLAHKSQLFKINENVDINKAVLIDPLASALQPAARHFPKDKQVVLVYGAGIIGLLLVASLRALGSKSKIIVVSRHDFQSELAMKMGADEVIRDNIFDAFANAAKAEKIKPSLGKPVFKGGVDLVYDCVGSSSTIDNAIRFLRQRGKIVIVGAAGVLNKIDAAHIWFREIEVTGSSMYSHIEDDQEKVRTYKKAIDLIEHNHINLDGLVTHNYPLSQFPNAVNTALDKGRNRSIKVIFNDFHS